MKTIPSELIPKKNALYDSDAWFCLFDIVLDDNNSILVTNLSSAVTYGVDTYEPAPIAIGNITEDAKGNLDTIELKVSNVNRTAIAYVENYDMQGKDVTIRLMNSYDTTKVIDLGTYQIMEITADERVVIFTLGHYNFFKLPFPSNRFNKRRCRWQFKSSECGYSGGYSVCDKTFEDCTTRANTTRFGGFPGIQTGRFVVR